MVIVNVLVSVYLLLALLTDRCWPLQRMPLTKVNLVVSMCLSLLILAMASFFEQGHLPSFMVLVVCTIIDLIVSLYSLFLNWWK